MNNKLFYGAIVLIIAAGVIVAGVILSGNKGNNSKLNPESNGIPANTTAENESIENLGSDNDNTKTVNTEPVEGQSSPSPSNSSSTPPPTPPPPAATLPPVTEPQTKTHTINMTSAGFSTSSLEIKKGDTVKFVSQDSGNRWPASDPHPIHTNEPGFDSKGPVRSGESYEHTFTKTGTFGFHDHLAPQFGGIIIVE